jgi:hypothetical protein
VAIDDQVADMISDAFYDAQTQLFKTTSILSAKLQMRMRHRQSNAKPGTVSFIH